MYYDVRRITYSETKHWILNIHYAHRMPSISYAYGLFDNEKIVGVVTFGAPASPYLCKGVCGETYRNIVMELNRLVVLEGLPKNTCSYFISRAIKLLPKPKILVSYADSKMTHIGYVYQATNWIYTGATKPRTDMASKDGKHSRHHSGDRNNRVFRSSKHRYIYFHGCDKECIKSLRYPVLSYPKGVVTRYPIDNEVSLCR